MRKYCRSCLRLWPLHRVLDRSACPNCGHALEAR